MYGSNDPGRQIWLNPQPMESAAVRLLDRFGHGRHFG
jgi:hypothetical protein